MIDDCQSRSGGVGAFKEVPRQEGIIRIEFLNSLLSPICQSNRRSRAKAEIKSTTVAGSTVGSFVIPLTASMLMLKQHPFGTLIIAVLVTLKKFSVVGGSVATAAGVTIALLVRIGSPSRARDTLIGPTVPVDGTAMFPLKVT